MSLPNKLCLPLYDLDDLLAKLTEAFQAMTGEEFADTAARILQTEIVYVGDSLWRWHGATHPQESIIDTINSTMKMWEAEWITQTYNATMPITVTYIGDSTWEPDEDPAQHNPLETTNESTIVDNDDPVSLLAQIYTIVHGDCNPSCPKFSEKPAGEGCGMEVCLDVIEGLTKPYAPKGDK